MTNRDRLLILFEQLIAFDSPSYGEREICDFIKGRLADLGIAVCEDGTAKKIGGNCGNLYAYVDGALNLPPLLFCAHMDTVEPSRGKQMRIAADGTITSDGKTVLGADDCAGIAAILEALTAVAESGRPHRPVEILFTVAEEPYCVGIQQFDFSKLRSKEAYVFDLTGPVGGAAYQAPTILSFEAICTGRSSHAGFAPEKGIHAVKAAGAAVAQIPCGKIGDTTVNIGTISGGTADNIVPDRCTLTGEIRSFSDKEAHAQFDEICNIMKGAAKDYGAAVAIQGTANCTAYRTNPVHSAVQRFESACSRLNLKVDLGKTFGGSDNNHLALHGINGIVVATAMNNCHSCAEYTTEQELVNAANLALALMLSEDL